MTAGQTALVTGASSGIGYELSKVLAREHYDLVLVSRDAQRLNEVAGEFRRAYGVAVRVYPEDLSDPLAPERIFRRLHEDDVRIQILVNNAGYGSHGAFASADLVQEMGMIQVNVAALTHLTKLLLPPMMLMGAGRILNVASTAAFQPGPFMAVYYATKAYVLSFSEALAGELRGSGVTVTALCPGLTATNFQARAHIDGTKLFAFLPIASASSVAEIGYRGMMRGRALVIPGWVNCMAAHLVRWMPRNWVTSVIRGMQKKRSKW